MAIFLSKSRYIYLQTKTASYICKARLVVLGWLIFANPEFHGIKLTTFANLIRSTNQAVTASSKFGLLSANS